MTFHDLGTNPIRIVTDRRSSNLSYFFIGALKSSVVISAMSGYDGLRGSVFYLAVHPKFQGPVLANIPFDSVSDILFGLAADVQLGDQQRAEVVAS